MDDQKFWELIQVASRGVAESDDAFGQKRREAMLAELLQLPPDEIMHFRRLFDQKVDLAFSYRLWGAAYLINGGCSDDGFYHFSCWLVGTGHEVYRKTLQDPDSLADLLDGEWPLQASYASAAQEAWTQRSGREYMEFYKELEQLGRLPADTEEEDEYWDFDFDDNDEMRERYPRLSEIYLSEMED